MKDKSMSIKQIYAKFNVPDNIIRHMKKVAAICLLFAEKVQLEDNTELITAALCHDIKKLHGPHHEDTAGQFFVDQGRHNIGHIISKHRYTSLVDPDKNNRPETLDEKIVYYADKRVLHDHIVSVDERLTDGRKRYPVEHGKHESDKKIEEKLKEIEHHLCEKASVDPDDINDQTITPYLIRVETMIDQLCI